MGNLINMLAKYMQYEKAQGKEETQNEEERVKLGVQYAGDLDMHPLTVLTHQEL